MLVEYRRLCRWGLVRLAGRLVRCFLREFLILSVGIWLVLLFLVLLLELLVFVVFWRLLGRRYRLFRLALSLVERCRDRFIFLVRRLCRLRRLRLGIVLGLVSGVLRRLGWLGRGRLVRRRLLILLILWLLLCLWLRAVLLLIRLILVRRLAVLDLRLLLVRGRLRLLFVLRFGLIWLLSWRLDLLRRFLL